MAHPQSPSSVGDVVVFHGSDDEGSKQQQATPSLGSKPVPTAEIGKDGGERRDSVSEPASAGLSVDELELVRPAVSFQHCPAVLEVSSVLVLQESPVAADRGAVEEKRSRSRKAFSRSASVAGTRPATRFSLINLLRRRTTMKKPPPE